MIALALLIAAYALIRAQDVDPPPDTIVWIVVLLVQSIPYLAAVAMAVISSFARIPSKLISTITAPPGDGMNGAREKEAEGAAVSGE